MEVKLTCQILSTTIPISERHDHPDLIDNAWQNNPINIYMFKKHTNQINTG